jgi:hypothetical protein
MRVIICGGRNVGRTDPNALHLDAASEIKRASAARRFVSAKMDELHVEKPFGEIIAGNEGGAERLGISWAVFKRIPHKVFERKNRKETTFERNIRMLRESQPDLIIAFGGDESTTALLMEAKRLGVPAVEIALPQS